MKVNGSKKGSKSILIDTSNISLHLEIYTEAMQCFMLQMLTGVFGLYAVVLQEVIELQLLQASM